MRQRDENKIQQVQEKAIELIVKEGLNGFSMQKLAKAAGVSPATLYIYYKDKDDLILQLGISEGKRMAAATLRGFDPEMSFSEGLRVQWRNRADFWIKNPLSNQCFEQLRHSPFHERIHEAIKNGMSEVLGQFVQNAVKNGELKKLPLEVYWAVAFGPLYTLVKFHHEGKSFANRPFSFSDEIMEQALELVLKGLKP